MNIRKLTKYMHFDIFFYLKELKTRLFSVTTKKMKLSVSSLDLLIMFSCLYRVDDKFQIFKRETSSSESTIASRLKILEYIVLRGWGYIGL